MKHFTTHEVAKILDVSEGRIRSCVRAGFVSPERGTGRQLQFTFQDLLFLKTTKGLLHARVPVKRIRRMLSSLRRQLPEDQQLTSLTIYADGRRIVAWDGAARWQPDSGQFYFNFDAHDVAEKVDLDLSGRPRRWPNVERASRSEREPPPPASPALTAEQWFNLACELEATSPEEARRAYHQALELDPALADAHVNLGRLYHEAGEPGKAEAHYRAAQTRSPDDRVTHFNLGVLLDDLERPDEAIHAYRQAIARDPSFADAHYNLGLLYERLGKRSEAMTHLRAARRLYGHSGARL